MISKSRMNNYCSNISMETIFMNTESSKANERHRFVINLSKRLKVQINMLLFRTYPFVRRDKIKEKSIKTTNLTLTCKGVLGVLFEVRGGSNYHPCLKLVGITL